MDKNLLSKGGSSDPLMKFELCGETATSTTKKKDLNPQRGRGARGARARRTPARAGGSSTSR